MQASQSVLWNQSCIVCGVPSCSWSSVTLWTNAFRIVRVDVTEILIQRIVVLCYTFYLTNSSYIPTNSSNAIRRALLYMKSSDT